MDIAAIVIGVCALLFTIFSFWWMNWRKGKLIVGKPRSYAGFCQEQGKLALELPFVFFNSGPTPVFIQNLRLVFSDEKPPKPLVFVATVQKLGDHDERAFATQFPVLGREAVLKICEFHRTPGERVLTEGSYPLELQAVLADDDKWETVCHFPLIVTARDAETIQKGFLVHDNMPLI